MASLPLQACCAKVVFQDGTPKGQAQKVCDLDCYVTENYTESAKKFLFIFTDVFGLELVNTRLVADRFAACLGYPVIIMDILNGNPFRLDGSMTFETWAPKHTPEFTHALTKKFFDAFKVKFPDTIFLAGIGYCFGAKYLAPYLTSEGLLDVGAFAHPSFVSDEELEAISKPLVLSCAEEDSVFPRELRNKSQEILEKNKVHYQLDLFSHVSHGFTVRGDLSIPEVKYAAEKAFTDQVLWFQYHDKTSACCAKK